MNVIKNALQCVNCQKTLSQPITLSCGHSICKWHIEIDKKQIICSECGSSSDVNNGFVVSKALERMIAQLDQIDFSTKHNKTIKASWDDLKKIDTTCNFVEVMIFKHTFYCILISLK